MVPATGLGIIIVILLAFGVYSVVAERRISRTSEAVVQPGKGTNNYIKLTEKITLW